MGHEEVAEVVHFDVQADGFRCAPINYQLLIAIVPPAHFLIGEFMVAEHVFVVVGAGMVSTVI